MHDICQPNASAATMARAAKPALICITLTFFTLRVLVICDDILQDLSQKVQLEGVDVVANHQFFQCCSLSASQQFLDSVV